MGNVGVARHRFQSQQEDEHLYLPRVFGGFMIHSPDRFGEFERRSLAFSMLTNV